jgi:hypothetical protein
MENKNEIAEAPDYLSTTRNQFLLSSDHTVGDNYIYICIMQQLHAVTELMATNYFYYISQANIPMKQQCNNTVFLSGWPKKLKDNELCSV